MLLAGAYPGRPEPAAHRQRIKSLFDAGMRTFIKLQEENETNNSGKPFARYDNELRRIASDRDQQIAHLRFPIPDGGTTSVDRMCCILDAIDLSLSADRPVYVHCFGGDDLLVFYAGLRSIYPSKDRHTYALVGFFTISNVMSAKDVEETRWHMNAHLRKMKPGANDIVALAKAIVSGRLKECISIGEWRDRVYRVESEILEAWGGLSVTNGYIQRSVVPPEFKDPNRFLKWFERQNPTLIASNN